MCLRDAPLCFFITMELLAKRNEIKGTQYTSTSHANANMYNHHNVSSIEMSIPCTTASSRENDTFGIYLLFFFFNS